MKIFLLIVLFSFVIYSNGQDHQSLIIGGEDAEPGEFPFMVGLWLTQTFVCHGVLIREDVVLTAAHCIEQFLIPGTIPVFWLNIVAGDHNLNSDWDWKIKAKVSSIHAHPDYTGFITNYTQFPTANIGVIRLDTNFTLSSTIQKIDLPKSTPNEINGVVAGWGKKDSSDKDLSPILQKAQMSLREENICVSQYETSPLGKYNKTAQFCAGDGQSRLCFGDSSAPFLLGREKILFGIGGVRDIFLCELLNNTATSFFTRVIPYVPWIESVMGGGDGTTTTTTAGPPTTSSGTGSTQPGTGSTTNQERTTSGNGILFARFGIILSLFIACRLTSISSYL